MTLRSTARPVKIHSIGKTSAFPTYANRFTYINHLKRSPILTIYEKVIATQQILAQENQKLQKQVDASPDGTLNCCRDKARGRDRWDIAKDGKRTFLSCREKELASQLALKRLNLKKMEDNNRELKAIEAYLRYHREGTSGAEKLLQQSPALADLVKIDNSAADWMNKPYRKNTVYPEHLIFQAPDGQFVRSKSEVEIITVLIELGIPYRYECAVCNEGFTYYPDFTVWLPEYNILKYWEHLGRIDDPAYRKDNFNKISWYIDHSIIPQENLILTYETRSCPFTIVKARNIANYYFS